MEFQIERTWDSHKLSHEAVTLSLLPANNGMKIIVDAPYFGDCPVPPAESGKPCDKLWDYEVVEAFFTNVDDMYLEVELSPHGQHLLLLLNGCRNCVKDQLHIDYRSCITGDRWHGEALLPSSYFPPKVSRFNAYAIHGSGEERSYEALFPVPRNKYTDPDFHRLEYFEPLDVSEILPENHTTQYCSEEWDKFKTGTET